MERMKTRFIIAVTDRLASAAESAAKIELIEELSDNLYSRWQDLISTGAEGEEAYRQALDELGDVDELLAYLASLGPEGELPKRDFRDFTSELLHGVEGIVRETVNQTRDAVDQAAEIVRNVSDRIRERYPEGFKGRVYVHFDGDDASEEPACSVDVEPERTEEAEQPKEERSREWSFAVGYNKDRGGFYCESSHKTPAQRVTDTSFPSRDLKGVDIQLINGDVTISLEDDPEADIRIDGDVDRLDVRVNSETGVLSIRQENTASSSFFFRRGLVSADLELTLPRRCWEFLQVATTNGDVELEDGLEVRKCSIKTASGDASLGETSCTEFSFKSASGDLEAGLTAGSVQVESSSGDITLAGEIGSFRAATASGDIEMNGSVREVRCTSASGDVSVETETVPEQMEISSKSGDCEVTMPGGQGFTLQFSTVSGDLDTDFELVGPVGARSGEALYLDGGGRVFHITSVSGDISLQQM